MAAPRETPPHPGRTVANPILRGFMPDPSIVRVGDEYFIANSSFEWHPVIPIHRSTDLENWEFAGSVTATFPAYDLGGVAASRGVWAPSLSHQDGRFWIVFAVVHTMDGGEKDLRCYITRATSVGGNWDAPTRVPASGFDPSLFHHEGRVWLLNIRWDHRADEFAFAGILLQELDPTTLAPIGPEQLIYRNPGVLDEGPNLYFRDGWFWLTLARGGTGWEHGIVVLRSRTLQGPYETDPTGDLLTTRDDPESSIQKSGHGELVTAPNGDMYLAHLGSRVIRRGKERFGALGRETFLQRVVYDPDGWPRLADGGVLPAETVWIAGPPGDPTPEVAGFGTAPLGWPWSTLRHPAAGWADLESRPGWLRLRGRDGLNSLFDQSLVARRIRERELSATVTVDAVPRRPEESACLVIWYDTTAYLALQLSADDDGRRTLQVLDRDGDDGRREHGLAHPAEGVVTMRCVIANERARFDWALDGSHWAGIGPEFDILRFSDDPSPRLRFTGPMLGVTAIDSRAGEWTADFGEPLLAEIRAPLR